MANQSSEVSTITPGNLRKMVMRKIGVKNKLKCWVRENMPQGGETDIIIVPVGSSGKILASLWFLKMTRKISLGDSFYRDFNLLDSINKEKSWWHPKI